jgi:hypothetical protein
VSEDVTISMERSRGSALLAGLWNLIALAWGYFGWASDAAGGDEGQPRRRCRDCGRVWK